MRTSLSALTDKKLPMFFESRLIDNTTHLCLRLEMDQMKVETIYHSLVFYPFSLGRCEKFENPD